MKTLCLGCMQEYEGDYNVCPHCGYEQDSPAKEAYHIAPGTVIRERYIVGRVLGFGGFGITYIGFDQTLQHKVAIKEYFPSEFATRMPHETQVRVYAGEKKEQFIAGMKKTLDEAKRLAEFHQVPGITQIYDFFEENNTAYIVMELLEGETLKARLKKVGKLSVEEALPIIMAVIGALKEVHAKNIIHRDISPDNIYLLENGQVKLLDFGAARQVTTTHSKSLTVILKLGYAPVEQYQSGGNQGPWTDVYSLAATFYKMITGIRPPESPERRVKDTLKEPSKLGVTINKNIENALMNALHVKIADRTKSAEEFEQALTSNNVKRTAATVEKNDLGQWPLWLKAVCAAAGAAVLVFGALLMTGVIESPLPKLPGFEKKENMVWMPSLVNMSQSTAKERLESLGLKYEVGGTQASETIMEGYVLGQVDEDGKEVSAGIQVEKGSLIRVVISSGSGRTTVPDVVWMTEANAMAMLQEEGLIAVNTETDPEGWAPAGFVTGIRPDRNSEIDLDEVITLQIASGKQAGTGETEVPEFTGFMEEEGLEKAKAAGVFLEKEGLEYNKDVPKGQIFGQSPKAGTKGNKGDIIKVKISLGARQIQLISVLNQERQEAVTNLESIGMAVSVEEEYNAAVEEGRVISQSVEPGLVDEGTEITIVVSLGREPERPTQGRNSTSGGGRTNNPPANNNRPANTGGGQPAGNGSSGASAPANNPVTTTEAPAPPSTSAPTTAAAEGRDSDFDRLQ